jgi:hypothetical protein
LGFGGGIFPPPNPHFLVMSRDQSPYAIALLDGYTWKAALICFDIIHSIDMREEGK